MEDVPICDEQHEVCQNGGVCVILSDPRFNFCKCTEEFAGAKCHGRVDDADNISICTKDGNQCQNGGKCVFATEMIGDINVAANYCQCPEGVTGTLCHGTGPGEKSQLQEAAEAAAEEAFAEGEMQDQDPPPSVPSPNTAAPNIPDPGQDQDWCTEGGDECKNGAICILKDPPLIPHSKCECQDDFFGALCIGKHSNPDGVPSASAKKICTPDGPQCKNGATCEVQDEANGSPENHCKCVKPFFGEYCKGKHSENVDTGITNDADAQNTPSEAFTDEFSDPADPFRDSAAAASVCSILGDQCQNGGVCVKGTNQVDSSSQDFCSCPEGTSGDLCESVGACDLTCQHGGSCRHYDDIAHTNDNDSAFECECVGDYKGVECEIPFTKCPITSDGKDMECLYGGTCVFREEENEYGCACPDGRSGAYCEAGTDSTIEDYNGACYEDGDCLNGGLCVRKHDAETTAATNMVTKETKCICSLGWGGDNCEFRCTSLSCQHGSTCRFKQDDITHDNDSGEAGAYCDCPDNKYKGMECEIKVEKCPGDDDMECLYGGQCIGSEEDADGNFYNCACPPGRIGVHCEKIDALYNPYSSGNNAPYTPPTITTQASRRDIDQNIVTVAIVSLIFLFVAPCTVFFLGRHRRRKAAAKETVADSVEEQAPTPPVEEEANGKAAQSEDIFDYDGEGVVNINLDENEPVLLPKDKQIV